MGPLARMFDFFARRVFALACIIVGTILSLNSIGTIFSGGAINMNGAPTDDIVLQGFAVLWPLVIAVLGVALYRAKPLRAKPGSGANGRL
jgi:hypothetical protein